jgi:hypothetical protein
LLRSQGDKKRIRYSTGRLAYPLNLLISPLLENCSGPAYADDSYNIVNKRDKIRALQKKILDWKGWFLGLGLRVNLKKTEQTIFHRHNTASANIRVKQH